MDWRTVLCAFALVYYADGFSKYGRTCKDIGCLSSQVCVLAEDPCSFGHTSDCGTYPTCKKKSEVEGSHSEPAKPAAPKPQTPTRDFDSAPNYNPPAPPANGGSPYGGSSPYGGNSHTGGNSPYGGSSPYGGNSPYGGSSPYSGNSHSGGNSPYGGGSPYGGSSPYGGGSNTGGGSPYGGSSPYGGNSPYGGSSHTGGSNPYGGNSPYGGSSSSGGGSPIDSILKTLNKYAGGGGGGGGSPGSSSGGSGLSNVFGNILGDLSKSGGLSNIFNTRPIMENPNYSSYSSNSRSSNPQSYPPGNQQTYNQPPTQNKNYGQSYAHHSGASTRKPVHYGWNVSVTVVLTYLIQQYIQSMIRN